MYPIFRLKSSWLLFFPMIGGEIRKIVLFLPTLVQSVAFSATNARTYKIGSAEYFIVQSGNYQSSNNAIRVETRNSTLYIKSTLIKLSK